MADKDKSASASDKAAAAESTDQPAAGDYTPEGLAEAAPDPEDLLDPDRPYGPENPEKNAVISERTDDQPAGAAAPEDADTSGKDVRAEREQKAAEAAQAKEGKK
jgi:hypothetical protein